jgi:hypothetical protein
MTDESPTSERTDRPRRTRSRCESGWHDLREEGFDSLSEQGWSGKAGNDSSIGGNGDSNSAYQRIKNSKRDKTCVSVSRNGRSFRRWSGIDS